MTGSKFKSPKRNLWEGILNRQRLLIFSLGVFVIAGLLACLKLKPKYQSEVLFTISNSQKNNLAFSESKFIEQLKNEATISSVIDDVIFLGEISQTPEEEIAKQKRYEKQIADTVIFSRKKVTQKSSVYSVKISGANCDVLKQVPELLVKTVLDKTYDLRDKKNKNLIVEIRNQINFVSRKIAKLAPAELKDQPADSVEDNKITELQKMKTKLDELRMKNETLSDKIARSVKEISSNKKRLAELLKQQTKDSGKTESVTKIVYGPNPKRAKIEKYILDWKAEIQRAKNEDKMTEDHPHIKGLREQIAKFQKDLDALPAKIEIRRIVTPESDFQKLNSKIDEVKKRLTELEACNLKFQVKKKKNMSLITKLSAKITAGSDKSENITINTPLTQTEADKAERQRIEEVNKLKSDRKELQVKLRNLLVEQGKSETQKSKIYKTLKFASLNLKPITPCFYMLLAIIFGASLLFAFIVVLVATLMDKTLTASAQAGKATGFTVLGSVGEICTKKQKSRRAVSWIVTPIIGTIFVVAAGLITINLAGRLTKTIKLSQENIAETINLNPQSDSNN